jgi:23S rRNA pseudouridine1911/1915/1917 synthase
VVTDTVSFVVEPTEAGQRLDKVVISRVPGLGRRRATELFARGRVSVDGRRAQKGDPARPGERIVVELGGPDHARPDPEAPLSIVLETAHYVIADKPAGQPSAPLSGEETGTLANALVARYPEMAEIGFTRREPGLIHRLDTETSGLIAAARSPVAFERLRQALAQGAIDKRYLAVVASDGLPDTGVVEHPLAQDRRHPERVLVCANEEVRGARRAVTRYRVLERGARFALVEVSAPRAFRHQVRAHLASIGHPIAGDVVYGGPELAQLGRRHALHASRLAWPGEAPIAGFDVDCPLPDALRTLLAG